jgi:hypothetical protein
MASRFRLRAAQLLLTQMLVFKNGEGGVVQLCMMWVCARCGKVFYVAGPVTSDQRKIWEQMRAIDKSVALPEAFVVQKFLYGLGRLFSGFRTSFNPIYCLAN